MNIKSLLLGSAAALVAVTGARAADVIVPVAPDPVDYVRVCDVYGKGFYYIPGTETCLSIGGYVRFKYLVDSDTSTRNDNGDDYNAGTEVRVRLNFDAREETELGTLRGFARVQATNGGVPGADAGYSMDMGYIQLGGLTMGYLDTLWTDGDGLFTDTDLPVGDFQVNRVSYTYAAGGFSAGLSLEDDATGDFAPDVVGRVAYDAGFLSAYIAGSYDENGFNVRDYDNGQFFVDDSNFNDDGAFAVKGAVTVTPFQDAQLKVEGSYAFDPSSYSTIGLFNNGQGSLYGVDTTGDGVPDFIGSAAFNQALPVEYQIGAGYQQAFGKLAVAASGVYGETFDLVDTVDFTGAGFLINRGSADYYKLVGNVGYSITSNFDVLAEVSYTNLSFDAGTDVDQTSGFIQFVRNF